MLIRESNLNNLLALYRISVKPVFWLACLTVTGLSLMPVEQLPDVLLDWWDKAQHALAFFVLTTLGYLAYCKLRGVLYGGLLALGGVIEILQAQLGWRYGDIADLVADTTGIVIAAMAIALLNSKSKTGNLE